jgi:hypothetical protein
MPQSSARFPAMVDGSSNSQVAPSVEVYSKDKGYVIAVCGTYFIQILKARLTNTSVSLMRRAVTDLSERHEKFGFLVFNEPEAQLLMDSDIRSGISGVVKRFSPCFTGAAIVYEKAGFHATAIRSLVTAINFASRASHPNQVFADLRAGVSWLSKLTPGEPTGTQLMHVVKELRASL